MALLLSNPVALVNLNLASASRTKLTHLATNCATYAVVPIIYATCPARPNPVNELSVAIFKAYQVEADSGSNGTYYEFLRPVGIYALTVSSNIQ